jgi:nucleotide-binding universal stress UspA family protein
MRILAGIDLGMEGHDWLLTRATRFAEATGGTLDLVYVSEDASHVATLGEMLEKVPAAHRGKGFTQAGAPEDVLIELSRTYDAMVIGPREPAGLERYTQGAMAVRILRRSRAPVYVPRTDRLGVDAPKLLVGVDLESDRHDYVLDQAAVWADRMGGTFDAVFAIPRSLPPLRRPELIARAEKEWAAAHEPERERLAELLKTVGTDATRGDARIAHGEPEDVLINESGDYHLVLVGNRERRGLSRLLLGGVARHVVRQAGSDVLILPTAFLGQLKASA